jgi:hypothetical protein
MTRPFGIAPPGLEPAASAGSPRLDGAPPRSLGIGNSGTRAKYVGVCR